MRGQEGKLLQATKIEGTKWKVFTRDKGMRGQEGKFLQGTRG